MKLPRDLSGEELVKHLSKRWDYVKIHQVGSHNPRSQGRDLGHPVSGGNRFFMGGEWPHCPMRELTILIARCIINGTRWVPCRIEMKSHERATE